MKDNGLMTHFKAEANLYSVKEIFMMANGKIVYLKAMVYMSVEIQFGDMRGIGKQVSKMGKEKKFLRIVHIIKEIFKKD